MTQAPDNTRPIRWGAGLAHLSVVYVVRGSTYLAIRVEVREGSGIEPFMLGATRTLAAGFLLLGWNILRRTKLRPTRREAATLLASGLLLWIGGNGLVNWAEQHADSGYAALLVGTMPLWVLSRNRSLTAGFLPYVSWHPSCSVSRVWSS